MHGTIRIVPTTSGSPTVLVDADFTAHVPLIGKKVEKLAAPIITQRDRRRGSRPARHGSAEAG